MAWQIQDDLASSDAVEQSVAAILSEVQLCAVGAVSSGDPWLATVYFAARSSTLLYALTPPSTRHATAWQETRQVAIAIYDSNQSFDGLKRGLQLTARTREIPVAESAEAIRTYGSRFPSMGGWLKGQEDFEHLESRFYEMTVLAAKIFDEPSFGAEVWLHATVSP